MNHPNPPSVCSSWSIQPMWMTASRHRGAASQLAILEHKLTSRPQGRSATASPLKRSASPQHYDGRAAVGSHCVRLAGRVDGRQSVDNAGAVCTSINVFYESASCERVVGGRQRAVNERRRSSDRLLTRCR